MSKALAIPRTSRLRKSVLLVPLLALILAGALSGCMHWIDATPVNPEANVYQVYGAHALGQTFVCHHAGLDGISLLLRTPPGAGEVVLHLRESASSIENIASATISPVPGAEPVFQHFVLPVQDDVNGRSFFLLIESPGTSADNAIQVPYQLRDPSDDVLYLDGESQPGNLSFQLHYHSLYIAKDVGRQAIRYGAQTAWLLFLSLLLFLLPGGAAVAWFLRDGDWVERLIVAAGLGVAINALLVYATMTGLRLSSALAVGFLVLCGVLIAVRWGVAWKDRPREGIALLADLREGMAALRQDPVYLVLGIVVLLTLGVRIWIMRGMVAPRWGDSYQHVVITQLLIDHGGLFESWEPYAPYTGLTTHFGFHANAVLFHWISGSGAAQSVLWMGQVLNALAALALYPLGKRIGGRWAGTVAVLVGGLLSATPMIYVNWGRYPQLTGQVLLPIAGWLLWNVLEHSSVDWPAMGLLAVVNAGQFLSYYRMPYYFAALAAALVICVYVPSLKLQWRRWGSMLLRVVAMGVLTALILVPWGLHLMGSQLGESVVVGMAYARNIDYLIAEYQGWTTIRYYVSASLLVASAVAFLWGLFRRATRAITAGVWGGGLFVLVSTRMIGLPGAAHLNTFASMIFMYAPVGLLVGWLGSRVVLYVREHWGGLLFQAAAGMVTLLALYGAYKSSMLSDPSYDLVKPADWEAMAWIRENTPRDAKFLVNGFSIYDGRSVVGSDAGWWIPLATERANTMPPQYALLNERELDPGYGQRMVDLVAGLRQMSLSTPGGLELICGEGITHVYVGQSAGRVGVPPPEPLFTPEEMATNPAFEVVYHQDNVWIFALTQNACHP